MSAGKFAFRSRAFRSWAFASWAWTGGGEEAPIYGVINYRVADERFHYRVADERLHYQVKDQ